MTIDVIAYNALARSIDAKKDQIAEQRRLRDSSQDYVDNTVNVLSSYQQLIDSADSFIGCYTPVVAGGYDIECFHTKYQSCMTPPSACGFSGIKMLCDYIGGAVTGEIKMQDCGQLGSYAQCGVSCAWTAPAGVSRVQVFVQAPGGPSLMANCCGGYGYGPNGGFASTVYCMSAGDTLQLCSGCVCCCLPYCCGYTLYRSCNSYVCTCIGGVAGCIVACSPHPSGCCETQVRNTYGGSGGVTCYNFWHGSQCLCGGYSPCHSGEQGNCWFDCYGPWNCGTNCQSGRDACGHQYDYCSPIVTDGSAGNINNIVPGSCFSSPGWWHWWARSENCHWHCTPGTAYGLKVQACDVQCCSCTGNSVCCGRNKAWDQGYFRVQGQGGAWGMQCGGNTSNCSDMGRSGGVFIAWC